MDTDHTTTLFALPETPGATPLPISQVARYFGVSVSTLQRLVTRGAIANRQDYLAGAPPERYAVGPDQAPRQRKDGAPALRSGRRNILVSPAEVYEHLARHGKLRVLGGGLAARFAPGPAPQAPATAAPTLAARLAACEAANDELRARLAACEQQIRALQATIATTRLPPGERTAPRRPPPSVIQPEELPASLQAYVRGAADGSSDATFYSMLATFARFRRRASLEIELAEGFISASSFGKIANAHGLRGETARSAWHPVMKRERATQPIVTVEEALRWMQARVRHAQTKMFQCIDRQCPCWRSQGIWEERLEPLAQLAFYTAHLRTMSTQRVQRTALFFYWRYLATDDERSYLLSGTDELVAAYGGRLALAIAAPDLNAVQEYYQARHVPHGITPMLLERAGLIPAEFIWWPPETG